MTDISTEYRGWWRIVDTEAWAIEGLNILGLGSFPHEYRQLSGWTVSSPM